MTERENNRRREQRRRAIAAKIFAGLRTYGNYNLPKHCDNNEVLKALASEAGWVVEHDGTTYRKGNKPPERTDAIGHSASPSPCTSYQPSPYASYNPSPVSSSFPSPKRSPNSNENNDSNLNNALLPWHRYMQQGGSISTPVTPPLSSPTCRSPRRIKTNPPDSSWLSGICIPNGAPTSPTFSFVSQNPFNQYGSSRMWTPGQSGTCSPVVCGQETVGAQLASGVCDEFAFGSSSDDNNNNNSTGLVKAWEGERIHEECGPDELELTLGTSRA